MVFRKMIPNGRQDRIEIVAPVDARAIDIKKLRSLGAVHIHMKGRVGRLSPLHDFLPIFQPCPSRLEKSFGSLDVKHSRTAGHPFQSRSPASLVMHIGLK
jgi:hypothetical protein